MEQPDRFDTTVGSAGTAGSTGSGDIPACLATLFNGTTGKCGGPVCHAAGAAPGGNLDLSSPGVSARLVDVNASHGGVTMGAGVTCPTAKLVDTSNRAASWLLVKINSMQGSCGTAMPQVGMLTAAEMTCITDWVQSVPAASTATGGTGGTGGGPSVGGGGAATAGGSGGVATTGGSGGASTTGGTSTAGGNGGTAGRGAGGNGGTAGRGAGGTGGARGGASGSAGTGGA